MNTPTTKISFFVKHKKKLLIVLSVIIILYIYNKYFTTNKVDKTNIFTEDEIVSNEPLMVPDCELPNPIVGGKYTLSFWIFINKHYENYLSWKHIFHKGTPISQNYMTKPDPERMECKKDLILDYEDWFSVITEIQEQCPGLWIHPTKNDIRFAITTNIIEKFNKCDLHAHKITRRVPEYDKPTPISKDIIEYYDIKNIPINKLTHIAIIVNVSYIDIYIDGKQLKIFNLQGTPKHNAGAIYFNFQKTYNGFIKNFLYSPKAYDRKDIEKLYYTSNLKK